MRKWIVLLAAAALLALPAVVFAGVQGSLHDVDAYTATEGKVGGACAYCHIPHGAQGDKLYKDVVASSPTTRWMNAEQPVSRICSTCHNATGGGFIVSANQSVAMFNDNAHRDVVATLVAWGDNANLAGSKLSTDSNKLECTSCHDPHETIYRPFLKFVATAGDIHANCKACHARRANDAANGGGSGNHVQYAGGGYVSQHPTAQNMTGNNPGDQPEGWQSSIDTAFTAAPVVNTSQQGLAIRAGANGYWSSKGKYGINSTVGCQTCHAVHGVESGANGATGTVSFHNQTQKGTGVVVLAKDRTPLAAGSVFCQGCHTTNAVTTAGLYHPVNTLETAWRVAVDVANLTYTWTWPVQGGQSQIVCETCHDVHAGTDNTAILRKQASNTAIDNQTATDYSSVGAFCGACHATSPGKTPTFATGNHHPVSYLKNGTTVLALNFTPGPTANISRDTGTNVINHSTIDWSTRTRTQNSTPFTWGTIGASTVMTCGSCHGNTNAAGAGAHTLAFPLDTNTESELCVDCHSFNPSTYTLDYEKTASPALNDNSLMTHFVGPIPAASAYKSTAVFPGTVAPKYSTDGSNGSIICESCHYWRPGNLTAFNVNANGHDQSVVQDNVYGMIAVAGNNTESTTPAAYMCSGCHGAAPGGGSSHPTRPAGYTSNASQLSAVTAILGTQTNVGLGRATLNSTNRVNCDSCHRAHNATQGTGALILEGNDTTPPSDKPVFQLMADNTAGSQLNQEGTCQRCHPQGR